MKQPDTRTFCPAPWFQIRNQNDMSKRVCGVIKDQAKDCDSQDMAPLDYLNTDHVKQLKKDLHNGVRHSACEFCWKQETVKTTSLRQQLLSLFAGDTSVESSWMKSYFDKKQDFESDLLLSADVKIGNTCNHACVMCFPHDSSLIYKKWSEHKDSEFVKDYTDKDKDYLDRVKKDSFKNKKYETYLDHVFGQNKNLKFIKLLGGEPLLDQKLLSRLKELANEQKNKISLQFVTNGSIDVTATAHMLGNFKKISFVFSLEGIGRLQEYARQGSNWNFVEDNIKRAQSETNCEISVNHNIQTTTFLGFHDLAKWCNDNSVPMTLGFIEHPDYLSLSSMNKDLRRDAIEKIINPVITQNTFSENTCFKFEDAVKHIDEIEFDKDLHSKFLRYINWYEQDSKIKLKDLYPELL